MTTETSQKSTSLTTTTNPTTDEDQDRNTDTDTDTAAAAPLDDATIANLLEAIGDDEDFLTEVIDTYVAGAVDLLAAMQRAVAAGSAADLAWAAHDLKSSSSNLGGLSLAAVCQALESGARTGNLAGAAERVALADQEYQRVRGALAETLGR